jgi:NADP-dependent 3-hydroxy acid dehydrogenase YdfG
MGKVVLITGISSGFGKATAGILSHKGYIVYGISRKQTEDLNSSIKVLQADVTDINSVKTAIKTLLDKEGRIDLLINNAGMGISGSIA